ncbi:hypothetical protein TUM4249_32750 [Shewanella sp. KT0246]|nr:hypothetical protein TUM4249_32750 [Shewanella sp. KT0246]
MKYVLPAEKTVHLSIRKRQMNNLLYTKDYIQHNDRPCYINEKPSLHEYTFCKLNRDKLDMTFDTDKNDFTMSI